MGRRAFFTEEVLPTKICRKRFRKVTVLANGVKEFREILSIIDFCSVFNLKLLPLIAFLQRFAK